MYLNAFIRTAAAITAAITSISTGLAQALTDFTVTSASTQAVGTSVVTFTGTWNDSSTAVSGSFSLSFQNAVNFSSVTLTPTTDGLNVTLSGLNTMVAHSVIWGLTTTANSGTVVNNIWISNGLGSYAKASAYHQIAFPESGSTFQDYTAINDVVHTVQNPTTDRLTFPGAGTGDGQGYVQSVMNWDLISGSGVSSAIGYYATPSSSVSGSSTSQEQFILRIAASPVPEPVSTSSLLAVGAALFCRRRRLSKI